MHGPRAELQSGHRSVMAEQALLESLDAMGGAMASVDAALIHWVTFAAFAAQSAQVRSL